MRRVLASNPALVGAVLVLIGVLTWGLLTRPDVRVEKPRTVLVAPPATPLPRDSIREPKRNGRSTGSKGQGRVSGSGAPQSDTTTVAPNKPRSRGRKRSPARITPDRRRPSQDSQQPAQPSNPPSNPPQQRPPVDVTVPAPVTVCVRPVGGANCP